jgi:hypothetical protein
MVTSSLDDRGTISRAACKSIRAYEGDTRPVAII